ncbi:MAG: DNA cytosine methyltransferase [Ignavibacteriales bacterium]|nr:DNA cytosine methyltransferase [Ignavibacteriales bacterium]
MLKVLDAFAGAGGFSLGFSQAGYDVVGAIEIDDWAAETFHYNHKQAKVLVENIEFISDDRLRRELVGHEPDVILGGPPCQGFSICNKNSGDPTDPRNSLFTEFLRLGRIFQPSILIMENVPNIVKAKTHGGELVISIIQRELESLGYNVYHRILNALDYGIPQIRKRLFVIASKEKLDTPFPPATHYSKNEPRFSFEGNLLPIPTLWDAISDLPEIEACQGTEMTDYDKPPTNDYQMQMRLGSPKLWNHVAMKHTKRMVERFASMSWGDSVSDVAIHLKPIKRNGNGIISEKVYDQNNRRMHPGRPCHTIAASFYANFVHPYKHRNFTPREGARIQSFPDWFIFKGKPTVISHKLLHREGRIDEKHLCQYNQIGNAVPPLMAKAIALNLLNQFEKVKQQCMSMETI